MIWNLDALWFDMSFLNNLNETCELLNKLDDVMMKNVDNNLIKQQLLSLTEDLARYKDIDTKNINFDKNEIKSKITDVLKRINDIETNVKNKLTLTEKYNSYLNS